eukprot:51777-Rhodomonas_salina.3
MAGATTSVMSDTDVAYGGSDSRDRRSPLRTRCADVEQVAVRFGHTTALLVPAAHTLYYRGRFRLRCRNLVRSSAGDQAAFCHWPKGGCAMGSAVAPPN